MADISAVHDEVSRWFESSCQTYTPQRRIVVQALCTADGPLDMAEIQESSGVSLSSVYRVVIALVQLGLVLRVRPRERDAESIPPEAARQEGRPPGYGVRYELRPHLRANGDDVPELPPMFEPEPEPYRSSLWEHWRGYAACKGMDHNEHFFNASAALEVGSPEAHAACRRCVVRKSCLEDAILTKASGFRALTTYGERQKIAEHRSESAA